MTRWNPLDVVGTGLIVAVALTCVAPLQAQRSSTVSEIRVHLLDGLRRNEAMDLAYLDAAPDSMLRWAPSPEVRDFAEQLVHTTHDFFRPWREGYVPPDSAVLLNDRGVLARELRAGYAWARARVDGLSDDELLATVRIAAGITAPRWREVQYWLDHAMWTRASVIPYLRIHGVTPPPVDFWGGDLLPVDRSAVVAATDSFRLVFRGAEAGMMRTEARWDDDTLLRSDTTTFGSEVHEVVRAAVANGRQLASFFASGTFGEGLPVEIDLRSTGGRVQGSVLAPRGGAASERTMVDRVLPSGAYERGTLLFKLVEGLPLEASARFTASVYFAQSDEVRRVTLDVGDAEQVDVPAGSFAAWPVTTRGASPENVVYVSVATPHRIVRIDVVGQPMHFELVESTSPPGG